MRGKGRKSEERLILTTGTYRNHLGAELKVLRLYGVYPGVDDLRTLGCIWLAVQEHDLFGPTRYLVTREGMESAGYRRIVKE